MDLTLHIWRQKGPQDPGRMVTYPVPGVSERRIATNGIKLNIAEAGEGPLVLMLHGFPESWYSWRHQFAPLAAAGYHAVASGLSLLP